MANKQPRKDEDAKPAEQVEFRPAGVAVIEAHLRTLDATPGVYRMINAAGDVLYVIGGPEKLAESARLFCPKGGAQ